MIYIPCRTCKDRRTCASVEDVHRLALFAHFGERESVDCSRYRADFWHGVEGVYPFGSSLDEAAPLSPRPSRAAGLPDNHRGGRQ